MSIQPHPHLSCQWTPAHDWDALVVARDVPDRPGYYAFADHAGPLTANGPGQSVLYVGIATGSLRKRLSKYKTGDTTGIDNMHRGGFQLLLSRASAVHVRPGERTQHSVQRHPISVTVQPAGGGPAQHSVIPADKLYVRWAVDLRAAIEALLIRDLRPKYNTMHR